MWSGGRGERRVVRGCSCSASAEELGPLAAVDLDDRRVNWLTFGSSACGSVFHRRIAPPRERIPVVVTQLDLVDADRHQPTTQASSSPRSIYSRPLTLHWKTLHTLHSTTGHSAAQGKRRASKRQRLVTRWRRLCACYLRISMPTAATCHYEGPTLLSGLFGCSVVKTLWACEEACPTLSTQFCNLSAAMMTSSFRCLFCCT